MAAAVRGANDREIEIAAKLQVKQMGKKYRAKASRPPPNIKRKDIYRSKTAYRGPLNTKMELHPV